MKRKIGLIGLVVVAITFFHLAMIALAQEQDICADALFTPALPQQFLPTNPATTVPFTVDFGTAFFSISQVVATSTYAASDPLGPEGGYFIDNLGGHGFGTRTVTSDELRQVLPYVLNSFLGGGYDGTYQNDALGIYDNSTDTFTLTSLRLCVTGVPEGVIQLGGGVAGLSPRRKVCKNTTTGQVVTIVDHQMAWDCAAAGLQVSPGDRVLMRVRGVAQDVSQWPNDITLKVTGIAPVGGRCKNVTTGQSVTFQSMAEDTEASCVAAGMMFNMGDIVVIQTHGPVE